MEYINSYSYFLMDEIFENVDYKWDFVNGIETDYRNNIQRKIKKSFDKSEDKLKWYERLLNKISGFNTTTKLSIISTIIPLLLAGGITYNSILSSTEKIDTTPEVKELIVNNKENINKEELKPFQEFIEKVAFRESSNNPNIVNRLGYMGLYQIGKTSLKDISNRTENPKLKDIHKFVTPSKFKEDPSIFPVELQNQAFIQLLKNNKHYLRRYYKYVGKSVGNILITESGLLGGAHLVGNGGVKKFLKSNGKIDPQDANGVHVSEYIKTFSGYKIDI